MRRTGDCSFRRRAAEEDGDESLRFRIYSLGNSRVRLLASFSIALTPTFLSLSASIAAPFSLSFCNRSDLPPLFSFSVASVRSSSFGSLSKRASSPSPFASSRLPTFGAKRHRLLRVVYRRSIEHVLRVPSEKYPTRCPFHVFSGIVFAASSL